MRRAHEHVTPSAANRSSTGSVASIDGEPSSTPGSRCEWMSIIAGGRRSAARCAASRRAPARRAHARSGESPAAASNAYVTSASAASRSSAESRAVRSVRQQLADQALRRARAALLGHAAAARHERSARARASSARERGGGRGRARAARGATPLAHGHRADRAAARRCRGAAASAAASCAASGMPGLRHVRLAAATPAGDRGHVAHDRVGANARARAGRR